jgi:hypothetical protein
MATPGRRRFLGSLLATAASAALTPRVPVRGAPRVLRPRTAAERASLGLPDPLRHLRGASSVRAQGHLPAAAGSGWRAADLSSHVAGALRERFPDLRRRLIFEYYPWYGTTPWYHWNEGGRTPPDDIAATSVPRLGPYDSRDLRVIEQHARWIAESGVGAINVSWWGRGDYTDLAVPRILDVMHDHDIKVTFHLEPYADDRARRYLDDIHYLLTEYGERRRWDTLLLLDQGRGHVSPVFKSFRTILPPTGQDCHGTTFQVPDFTTDGEWRRQTDAVRERVRRDFAHIHLLADSLDMGRTPAAGFDGIAVYDNFVTPDQWTPLAAEASRAGLLFSFNVNTGYDGYVLRDVPADSCYRPPPFAPGGTRPDWTTAAGRALAQSLALRRIDASFDTTTTLQADPTLSNAGRGFFLAYINSFNEWHEGHQFEPALDAADLSPRQRALDYHNPHDGLARLRHLGTRVQTLLTSTTPTARPPVEVGARDVPAPA